MAGPGKAYRKGLSVIEITKMFKDEETSRDWFEQQRWPKGPYCPQCGTFNVQSNTKHKTQTHRCRECKKGYFFTVRKGTVMESSNLSLQTWAIGVYLFTTGIKGTSSMKLHRDLDVTYKSAWHLAHRLRKAFDTETPKFNGPAEVDESFFGGKEANKHAHKKLNAGRGTVGKTAVVGIKDQDTNQVHAEVAADTTKETLQGFVGKHTEAGTTVYTDEAQAYKGLPGVKHETVKHSVGEYVSDQATVNGVESFWALMKRGYHGVYHH